MRKSSIYSVTVDKDFINIVHENPHVNYPYRWTGTFYDATPKRVRWVLQALAKVTRPFHVDIDAYIQKKGDE